MIQAFRGNAWAIAASGCIGMCAFLLRIFHLGVQELWLDEISSFHLATLPSGLAEALLGTDTPPLYYLLLRAWIPIAGTSEAAVRFPSAVAGTLCVLAVIWAGWQIFNRTVGLWAGGFVAVAPIHLYYSQEARTYTLVTLELALAYGFLWRAMRLNTVASWVLVSVAALTALHSHYYTALGLLPALFVLWVWPSDASSALRRKRLLIAGSVCVVLWVPWLFLSLGFFDHTISLRGTKWVIALWQATPPAMAIPRTLEVFALGPQRDMVMISMKQFVDLRLPDPMRWLGLGLLGGLALWVAVPWQDSRLNIPWLGRRKAWIASLLLTPLLILWLVSLYRPAYVVGRYDMEAFVGFALMMGLALAKLQSVRRFGNVLAIVAGLGLFVPIGTKLMLYYQVPATRYAQETAEVIHEWVANGDVVVFSQIRGVPLLSYYLPRLNYEWKNDTCRSALYNREFTCHLFIVEPGQMTSSPKFFDETVREFSEKSLGLSKVTGGHVWAVLGQIKLESGTLEDIGLDSLIKGELVKSGFQPRSLDINGVPVILLFRREAS